jgi:hypothetical protein
VVSLTGCEWESVVGPCWGGEGERDIAVEAAGEGGVRIEPRGFASRDEIIQLGEGGDGPASCLFGKGGRILSGGVVADSLLDEGRVVGRES